MTRIISVTSGTGGAGKTFLCIDLALALAGLGRRVVILDCASDTDNVHARLNIPRDACLEDVLDGRAGIAELPSRHPSGVEIIAAHPGVERLAMPDGGRSGSVLSDESVMHGAESILIDSSSCNPRAVVAFCQLSTEVILLLHPDTGAQAENYALLKILLLNGFGGRVSIVVNKVDDLASGERLFEEFRKTVLHYLALELSLMEVIISDPSVRLAASSQQSPLQVFPHSAAVASVRAIAGQIGRDEHDQRDALTVGQFWGTYARLVQTSLIVAGQLPIRDQEDGETSARLSETDSGNADDRIDADRGLAGISDILAAFDHERIRNPAGDAEDELYAIRKEDGSSLICAWHE